MNIDSIVLTDHVVYRLHDRGIFPKGLSRKMLKKFVRQHIDNVKEIKTSLVDCNIKEFVCPGVTFIINTFERRFITAYKNREKL